MAMFIYKNKVHENQIERETAKDSVKNVKFSIVGTAPARTVTR